MGRGSPAPDTATDDRLWLLLAALRRDAEPLEIARNTGIDPWSPRTPRPHRRDGAAAALRGADAAAAAPGEAPRLQRRGDRHARRPPAGPGARAARGVGPAARQQDVDTCAAEFDAVTPYFYSTYEEENDAVPEPSRERMLVIGSGPIRIGQGIEFDYCSVQAAHALQAAGVQSILANSNPETVSTDFDTSDRLYFEPLERRPCAICWRTRRAAARLRPRSSSSAARPPSPRAPPAARRAADRRLLRRSDRPRRGSRALRGAGSPASASRSRPASPCRRSTRRCRPLTRSATRCSSAPPTSSAGARWRSCRTRASWSATSRPRSRSAPARS